MRRIIIRRRVETPDAKGLAFISHQGDVFPSGFLPLAAGNIRRRPLADIYRNSPLFVAWRESSNLKGRCGVRELREICGGSRARAYALTGSPFAAKPCCVYEPKAVTLPRRVAPHPAATLGGRQAS